MTEDTTPATAAAEPGSADPRTPPRLRDDLRRGVRAVLPLAAAVFPFGIVYGAVVVDSSFDDVLGFIASFVVFAGAAQLALVELLDQGAPWTIALVTALVINLRHVMYSGALAPAFSEFPRRWRIPLAHLMTDQASVTSLLYFEREPDTTRRLRFYTGAGLTFFATWTISSGLGILLGATIPAELQLGFAIPLMFLSLLVPSVRDRPGFVAAAVAFAVTILAQDAPLNTGLLIGAGAGVAFGMLARR